MKNDIPDASDGAMTFEQEDENIRKALNALQKGIVFKEGTSKVVWDTLREKQDRINEILKFFSAYYILRENNEQYAYAILLRSDRDEESEGWMPNVQPLDLMTSWLLVLLRRAYKEWEDSGRQPPVKAVRSDIVRDLREYVKDVTDEQRFQVNVNAKFNTISNKWHLVRCEKDIVFIHSVITDVVDVRWLDEFCQIEEEKEKKEQEEERIPVAEKPSDDALVFLNSRKDETDETAV